MAPLGPLRLKFSTPLSYYFMWEVPVRLCIHLTWCLVPAVLRHGWRRNFFSPQACGRHLPQVMRVFCTPGGSPATLGSYLNQRTVSEWKLRHFARSCLAFDKTWNFTFYYVKKVGAIFIFIWIWIWTDFYGDLALALVWIRFRFRIPVPYPDTSM